MDTRLTIETARDRIVDVQQGLATSLERVALPVESSAYLVSAQRSLSQAMTYLDKAAGNLDFSGKIQTLVSCPVSKATGVVDGVTGELVS